MGVAWKFHKLKSLHDDIISAANNFLTDEIQLQQHQW